MSLSESKVRSEYELVKNKINSTSSFEDNNNIQLSKRLAELDQIIKIFDQLRKIEKDIKSNESALYDPELTQLAATEIKTLERKKSLLEHEIQVALIPKDPTDEKNVIMEIRAGTGGDEASLFAGQLYQMYVRYAESKGFKTELLSSSPSSVGGFKEIIFEIRGVNVYSCLKFESGVHRVQRIPVTESGGRIHTSTVTVAVLPKAEESELEIKPEELKIDVFRSGGHGGQSVNTTDSAVRITHLPTNLVVTCQDEKSQLKNKQRALGVLRSRLLALKIEEAHKQMDIKRRNQIGSGDRSEKIRTYNFPQDRITDHRINFSLFKIDDFLMGKIQPMIDALVNADHELALISFVE